MSEIKVRRPILRYYGGKFRIAPRIIETFPEHSKYVEPFCGAASVLLRKNRSGSEVLADADERVVKYLAAVRDHGEVISRKVGATSPTKEAWISAIGHLDDSDPVSMAVAMLTRSFLTRGTDEIDYPSASYRKHPISIAAWGTLPQSVLAASERLRGVEILTGSYERTFREHDSPSTLFYIDPPYLKSLRTSSHGYRRDFSKTDHEKMLALVRNLDGKVVISGYGSTLYDQCLSNAGWNKVRFSAMGDCAKKATEQLWMNF